MGIKHHTQTTKPDNPEDPVSRDEWNEDHDVTSGSATVLAGHDYVDVVHGVGSTPNINKINVNCQSDYWLPVKISNVGPTTFRINIFGVEMEDLVFGWTIL
jgi:hypothetical protein